MLVICRGADDRPIDPRSRPGFQCFVCGAELRVSPEGLRRIRAAPADDPVVTACNPCGLELVKMAEIEGSNVVAEFSPRARERMEEGPLEDRAAEELARWAKKREKKPS
jgi:hypothetical protein